MVMLLCAKALQHGTLASLQCGSGSNPGLGVICGLSLLLVLVLSPRGFSPGSKTNISKFKFDHLVMESSIRHSIESYKSIFFFNILPPEFHFFFLQHQHSSILFCSTSIILCFFIYHHNCVVSSFITTIVSFRFPIPQFYCFI